MAHRAPRLLVVQHISCEPPGAYEEALRERRAELVRIEIDEGEELPSWREFDAIVVMGGPMGAYEEARLPWLTGEKRLIAEAVDAGLPVWGVCLGAQLLAASLGAQVRMGPAPEVGVLPVHCTAPAAHDPVFALAPPQFVALQWHQDTFALPGDAVHLARSESYESQAFRVRRAYGLQFHLEVRARLAAEWAEVPAYAASLEGIMGPGALPALIERVARHERAMVTLARRLFIAWLDHVVEPSMHERARRAPEPVP